MTKEEKERLERRRKEWEKVARQSEIISWVLVALSVLSILLSVARIILRIAV